MAQLSFKDRFLTPPVARAMLSPSGILLAGAGAAAVVATGLPLVAAPVAAVAAWGARVFAAVPKNKATERIDPFTLPAPWRNYVVEALKAQVRFQQALERTEAGAIRSRLEQIGERIDDGINETWEVARRGAELVEARNSVDADDARRDLAKLEAKKGKRLDAGSALGRTAQALRSQIATADRLDSVIAEARSRLQLLDARLDEAVARTIELSVQITDAADLGGVGDDVDGLVSEMESLRQALEETSNVGRGATGTT